MRDTVLITNVGGTLAQGVLRTWKNLGLKLRILGLQWQNCSAANLFCDTVVQYPSGYPEEGAPDPDFLQNLCFREQVALIIPTTDSDTYYLKKHQHLLPPIACSDAETSLIFYDKLLTAKHFKEHGIPFAPTALPAEYISGMWKAVLAKPRRGGLSRDIFLNPPRPESFDDSFILQEFIEGKELTVGFYVTQAGVLHGFITMERILTRGSTSAAAVTTEFDSEIGALLSKILLHFPIRGACNLQAKVTAGGSVIPFELNARLSGTSALRAALGFPDNVWLLEEWLSGKKPGAFKVIPGAGVASYMFHVLPGKTLSTIRKNSDFTVA